MAVDKLQVELIAGNADKAVNDVQTFRKELTETDKARELADRKAKAAQAEALKRNKEFSASLASVQRQALDLSFNLRKVSEVTLGTAGADGLGKAVARAQVETRKIYSDLKSLDALASVTKDPAVLKSIQAESARASGELDRLQNKIERVAAGRQAAASRAGSGSGQFAANARGLAGNVASSALTGLGVPPELIGSGAVEALLAKVSVPFLATAGVLAIGGIALIKYSQSARAEAEKRLKVEENIAITINKQIIAGKEAAKAFADADAARQRERKFSNFLGGTNDIGSLQGRADTLKRLRDLNPLGQNAGEFNAQFEQLESRIDELTRKRAASQDELFSQSNELWKTQQQRQAAIEEETNKRRLDSINKGRQKVDELAKATDAFFSQLFASKGANNPFVAVYTEAEDAINRTRLATGALSDELQNTALDIQRTLNANALFKTRLENTISSVDLRLDAQNFRRGGGDSAAQRQLAETIARMPLNQAVNNPFSLLNRGVNNPFSLLTPGGFANNPDSLLNRDDSGRRRILELELQLSRRGDETPLTASQRLDKQISALSSLSPQNDAQRSEVDRRIIALTQGLNPDTLTDAQRNAAARSRENEAGRVEGLERQAQTQRTEQLNVQKSIDKNIADLLSIAKKEGFAGVIRIINDAEDKANVTTGKRPTTRDANSLTDQ